MIKPIGSRKVGPEQKVNWSEHTHAKGIKPFRVMSEEAAKRLYQEAGALSSVFAMVKTLKKAKKLDAENPDLKRAQKRFKACGNRKVTQLLAEGESINRARLQNLFSTLVAKRLYAQFNKEN